MTTKVTIDGQERIAVLFPFYDEEGCVEAMADGLCSVLQTVVENREAKQDVPPASLGQLVKMCRMLTDLPE